MNNRVTWILPLIKAIGDKTYCYGTKSNVNVVTFWVHFVAYSYCFDVKTLQITWNSYWNLKQVCKQSVFNPFVPESPVTLSFRTFSLIEQIHCYIIMFYFFTAVNQWKWISAFIFRLLEGYDFSDYYKDDFPFVSHSGNLTDVK